MDIVLQVFDTFLFDRLYAALLPTSGATSSYPSVKDGAASTTFSSMREMPTAYQAATQYLQLAPSQWADMSAWPRDNVYRQALTLYLVTWYLNPSSLQRSSTDSLPRIFGCVIYFICASLSYTFIFDHATFSHPKYLKNQVRLEIRQALIGLPVMAIFTVPFFLAEVRGYAKLYDSPSDAPFYLYNYLQFPLFIAFTDFCVYGIHRGLHHPAVYKKFHKAHHKWIMPTPFASHAFHPLDGFLQGLPYHLFPLFFPLQKFAYIALFVFINVWTVLIRKLHTTDPSTSSN